MVIFSGLVGFLLVVVFEVLFCWGLVVLFLLIKINFLGGWIFCYIVYKFIKLVIYDFIIKIYILVKFSIWFMNNGGIVKGFNNIRSVFVYWLGCLCYVFR